MEAVQNTQELSVEQKLWHVGPNYTADAVIIDPGGNNVLLIQRKDTGQWALPGGFVDKNETSLYAAQREAREETGLHIPTESAICIYQGPVEDRRNSDISWIETSGYLFIMDTSDAVVAGDDAHAVQWTPLSSLPDLYGSHAQILESALKSLPSE